MKFLFVGDIVGKPGRTAVQKLVPRLREQHGLDLCIGNSENSAGGAGITPAPRLSGCTELSRMFWTYGLRGRPAMLLVGVVPEISLIVFLTTAARQVDHVSVARILRKQHRLFSQTVMVKIFVEFAF